MTREEHEQQLTEAISEFCKTARQAALMLDQATRVLEDLRRQVTAIGKEPPSEEAAGAPTERA